MTWNDPKQCMPSKDTKVIWIDPLGHEVKGKFCGGVVWIPEGSSMYIYYTPKMWKYDKDYAHAS